MRRLGRLGRPTAPPPKYDSRVFFALVLAVESCALFLFLATDVFLFYVFFEVILDPDVLPDRRLRRGATQRTRRPSS